MRSFLRRSVALFTALAVLSASADAVMPSACPRVNASPVFAVHAVSAPLIGAQWFSAPWFRAGSVAAIALVAGALARAQTPDIASPAALDASWWTFDRGKFWISVGSMMLGFGARAFPKVNVHLNYTYRSVSEEGRRMVFFERLSNGLFGLSIPFGAIAFLTSQTLDEIVLPAVLVALDTVLLTLAARAWRALRQAPAGPGTLFRVFRTLAALGIFSFLIVAGTPGNALYIGKNGMIAGVTILALPIVHSLLFPGYATLPQRVRKRFMVFAAAILLGLIYTWTWMDVPHVQAERVVVPPPHRASLDPHPARILALAHAA